MGKDELISEIMDELRCAPEAVRTTYLARLRELEKPAEMEAAASQRDLQKSTDSAIMRVSAACNGRRLAPFTGAASVP